MTSKVANYINAARHYLMLLDIKGQSFRLCIYHTITMHEIHTMHGPASLPLKSPNPTLPTPKQMSWYYTAAALDLNIL